MTTTVKLTADQLELQVHQKRIELMSARDAHGIPLRMKCPELRIGLHPDTWRDVLATMSPKHMIWLIDREPMFAGCVVNESYNLPEGVAKIEVL